MSTIYCARHCRNEHLTNGEVEVLIYGLQAATSEAETDPDGDRVFAGDDVAEHVDGMCPTEQVAVYNDGELFAEHIESMADRRRRAALAGATS